MTPPFQINQEPVLNGQSKHTKLYDIWKKINISMQSIILSTVYTVLLGGPGPALPIKE